MLSSLRVGAALALSASGLAFAALPSHAQTSLPFTGDYTGGQTSSTPLTATTEEDHGAFTSTNASFSFDTLVTDYFVTFVSTPTSYTASLTPGTTSTFTATATDGSTLSGIFLSFADSLVTPTTQQYTATMEITGGTGAAAGVTGLLTSTGTANADDSVDMFHADGTLIAPAVPEASTTASFGLLLALGLGGLVIAARRKKTA